MARAAPAQRVGPRRRREVDAGERAAERFWISETKLWCGKMRETRRMVICAFQILGRDRRG